MTRKVWLLIGLAVALGSLSLYFNRDSFTADNIHIYYRSRPARLRGNRRWTAKTDPIVFMVDPQVKLTSVKVFPVSELQTNKYPLPIWHLVSDSNSVPIEEFAYGSRIGGMHPALKGTAPEPLEPGVTYRVEVEAGRKKAEHDFVPVAATQE